MKKCFYPNVILMVGIAVFFHLSIEKAGAQGPEIQGVSRVEVAEIEKTIQLLENPEETRKLAAQLRGILEARKAASEQEKAQVPETEQGFIDFLELFESHEEWFSRIGKRMKDFLEAVTLRYRQILTYLTQEKNWRKISAIGLEILLAFAVGLIIWRSLRRLTRRLEKKWLQEGDGNRIQKLGRVALAALIQVYPWIAVWVVFFLFFQFSPGTRFVKPFILKGLLALTLYKGLKHFLAFLLLPALRPVGLLPFKDETCRALFIWLRRILLFSLWIYLLYLGASHWRLPWIMKAVVTLFKVGLTLFAILILARSREAIQNMLSTTLRPEDPGWLSFFKKAVNYCAGKVYLFVLFYAGFLAVFFLAGPPDLHAFVVTSSAKSTLVILIGAGIWIFWSFLFQRLSAAARRVQETYPPLEPVSRYLPYLGDAGNGVIIFFSLSTILGVWGVNFYDFISQTAWLKPLLRIPFILLLAWISIQLAYFLVVKFALQARTRMLAAAPAGPLEVEKRISTITNIFKRVAVVVVVVLAGMMILSELGFDVKPILAGAGIVGLAVGFGAQNLVRDIISGLFYTFENRIRVGDVATINGTGGLVEQVNLRTIVLRGLDGTIHVFPNGAINTLSNMTYEFSYYLFDVGVAYKEDVDRVVAALKEIGNGIMQEEEYRSTILEPLEILGVDKFADSSVVIKARIKTVPIKQWFVGREMNRRIKKRFDELGIEIPFPHQSLYFGEASKPIRVKLEGGQERKEEIKAWIREVLNESRDKS
jgi:moderate conductance mechanosensitive channel